MEITKKVEYIAVEYYDCGIKNHRHKHKHTAEQCIQKRIIGEKHKEQLLSKKDRDLKIYNGFLSGKTFAELARTHRVGAQRIRQIICKQHRTKKDAGVLFIGNKVLLPYGGMIRKKDWDRRNAKENNTDYSGDGGSGLKI